MIEARLFLCVLAVLVGAAVKVRAHEAPTGWEYDALCCSERDCGVARIGHVVPSQDGWRIRLAPGDHHYFPGAVDTVVPYGHRRVRPSGDTEFHICLNSVGKVLCLYVPPLRG